MPGTVRRIGLFAVSRKTIFSGESFGVDFCWARVGVMQASRTISEIDERIGFVIRVGRKDDEEESGIGGLGGARHPSGQVDVEGVCAGCPDRRDESLHRSGAALRSSSVLRSGIQPRCPCALRTSSQLCRASSTTTSSAGRTASSRAE